MWALVQTFNGFVLRSGGSIADIGDFRRTPNL
jgi:hypothetical protein